MDTQISDTSWVMNILSFAQITSPLMEKWHTHTHKNLHRDNGLRSIFICTSIWTCNTKHTLSVNKQLHRWNTLNFIQSTQCKVVQHIKVALTLTAASDIFFYCDIWRVGWTPIFQWLLAIIQLYLNLKTSPVSSVT